MGEREFSFLWHALLFLLCAQNCGARKCQQMKAEIIFLLDASDNVGQEKFKTMKSFIGNFSKLMEDKLDPNQIRLSAVSFGSSATVHFSLKDCPYIQDMVGAKVVMSRLQISADLGGCIGDIRFDGGGRDVVSAMETIRADVIQTARAGVVKLLVLLTSKLFEDLRIVHQQGVELNSLGIHTLAVDVSGSAEDSEIISLPRNGLERIGTLRSVTKLHKMLSDLACRRKKRRVKRAWFDHFDKCGETIDGIADSGKTCATVWWDPPPEDVDSKTGGDPGDCFPEGRSQVEYKFDGWMGWGWTSGDSCKFTIDVRVTRCSSISVANGYRQCTGWQHNVYGSTCTVSCNAGYLLRGQSTLRCGSSGNWNKAFPTCKEVCTWRNSHCWPGDCREELAENCVCRPGFRRIAGNAALCELNTAPDLSTCRLAVTDSQGTSTNSTYVGNRTNCQNQRDEGIRTQPEELYFVVKAGLDLSLGSLQPYLSQSRVGVVGFNVTLIKITLPGLEIPVHVEVLNGAPFCQRDVSSTNPLIGGTEHDCEGTLRIPNLNLKDGECLCVDTEAFAGGFYNLQDYYTTNKGQRLYQPFPAKKRVCFVYDHSKPVHCSDTTTTCTAKPLQLMSRLTQAPRMQVVVNGWLDPIPPGGNQRSASKIDKYRLEVHGVDVTKPTLSVQENAISEHTLEWEAESVPSGGPYVFDISLPAEEPRLYALILEVFDHAGNVGYARSLLFYDNSSTVEILSNTSLTVTSANPMSGKKWQTDVSQPLCVDWQNRFHNSELYHNNFLMPVNPDTGRDIQPPYDQTSGLLPVSGTDNVQGVTKFESHPPPRILPSVGRVTFTFGSGSTVRLCPVTSQSESSTYTHWTRGEGDYVSMLSWRLDSGQWTQLERISDVYAQSTCLSETLIDGQTYDVLIRATDIMDNYKEDTVRVSIDHTGPDVVLFGLKGRLDRDVVYVHNTTDLSTMGLLVQAADPHSGLRMLQWTLGTHNLAHDIGSGAVGVQRLSNITDCAGQAEDCYCPSVGICELDRYLIPFPSLVTQNTHQGQHHRDYFLTITATNYASLTTTQSMQILVDDSPPSVGVVWEGLDDADKAEMDFTSSDMVHVRWHGFLDHESGILLYRIILAERCMTGKEMDAANSATVVDQGTSTTLSFPEEGLYYTSVVAYNGAMRASDVACSDGITYDKSPPRLLNVSITHARIKQVVGYTQSDRPWLVNSNLTRVRLSNTSDCLFLHSHNSSFPSVEHLPLSSKSTLSDEASNIFCRRLPRMTEDTYIVLPSDYLKVTWVGEDMESDMEDYYLGIGSDETTWAAPDLLPFTSTHGHPIYHARHSGLGHSDEFFIFLQAVNKAGLGVQLILGPVLIDVTPPDVTRPLVARIEGSFLSVVWDKQTFVDAEQPSDTELAVFFRVGHEDGFFTPFLSTTSKPAGCQTTSVAGCARYPLNVLHTHDTESGRHFFFQFHLINTAGHIATVNSSSLRLPARSLPGHAVIKDVVKTLETAGEIEQTTSMPITLGTTGKFKNSTIPAHKDSKEEFNLVIEVSDDVDIILQTEEICIAWNGLNDEEQIRIEIGIGISPDQDDVIQFAAVENTGLACINSSFLPVYENLFSVIRANNSAGEAIYSSDGFSIIPETDTVNRVQTFGGKGCTIYDEIGFKLIREKSGSPVDLSLIANVKIHEGDILYVEFTPFIPNVVFSEVVVLFTTLTGYQLVAKSSQITFTLPSASSTNTTVTIMNCLKHEPLLHQSPQDDMSVTWEIAGPWETFIKYFNVEVLDHTCNEASPKKNIKKHVQCLVAESRVGSTERRIDFDGLHLYNGHLYLGIVSACFDNACAPASTSDLIQYSTDPRVVVFEKSEISVESLSTLDVEMEASVTPSEGVISITRNRPCVFLWTVARDKIGSTPLTEWKIRESTSCLTIEVKEQVKIHSRSKGTLYACVQPVFPWRAPSPSCQLFLRQPSTHSAQSLHIIELPLSTFRETDFESYLHSQQLGSNLHALYDLDVDFARSTTVLSAVMTNSLGRNITWFLMTKSNVPGNGNCAGDPNCITSRKSNTGKIIFPIIQSNFQNGHVYFICATASEKNMDLEYASVSDDVVQFCGDGFVIDDSPPVKGAVAIDNTDSGYLSNGNKVMVIWTEFSDVETKVVHLPDEVTINYSVALGSYPGSEDIARYMPVGQRTSYTFHGLHITSGQNCIASVRAEDRVGHVTEVSSNLVIVDNTPPSVGHVAAGTTTHSSFVRADELPVYWEGVEDRESGVASLEVSVSTAGGQTEIIPFQRCEGTSSVLTNTGTLLDGHSYLVLLKAVNRAGLASLTSSKPFISDRSPPVTGLIWNSKSNSLIHALYSTDTTSYKVYWKEFYDPHSGLAYYTVGLGSQLGIADVIHPVYVGLQTSYTWKHDFEQGKKYYAIVEACNQAGLCSVTSSNSITFDNSPPTAGRITVGFDGHHKKYLGHRSSLPVRWTGFSDPQTGIQEFRWCVGTALETCDILPSTHTMLSQNTHRAGLLLPVATPLYVTVRARNPAGLDTVTVSDSFIVDPSAPEIVSLPHFLSPRDGGPVFSQWDCSVLRLSWKFRDSVSSVVRHTVYIRSRLTGRILMEPIVAGADTELTLTLDDEHLVVDGDSYWATVIACNGADLCTTAHSDLLLIDSTPPVMGTFNSPLVWIKDSSGPVIQPATRMILTWSSFADPESEVIAYNVAVGRSYDGEDLSRGQVKMIQNSTLNQSLNLEINEDLQSGDILYLSIVAENSVGLTSPVLRMAFEVFLDSAKGTSGKLVLVRHSCDIHYCTKECTCAPAGQVCESPTSPCRELNPSDPGVAGIRIIPHIGLPNAPQELTTSAKCLEGHWRLTDPTSLRNVSRFEWSYSLINMTAGEGVFDVKREKVWHDVGRNMTAVHCLPATRMLLSSNSYILHVRVWVSREEHVTFISDPVVIDHTPPQLRRGRAVIESNTACQAELDFVTEEPSVTACWQSIFQDRESAISKYEVWVGTSPLAADFVNLTVVGLNTSWSFSTSGMEAGIRYYVSVRAWNMAGLQTTAVSDGVAIDPTAPTSGVVFTSRGYSSRHAQSSTTSLAASWSGFEDRESGVTSYQVAVYDEMNMTEPLVPFRDVGVQTSLLLENLMLQDMHRYKISVKARDAAGFESHAVNSTIILVDATPPEGVACGKFKIQDEKTMVHVSTTDFSFVKFDASFNLQNLQQEQLVKIEVETLQLEPEAAGYTQIEEIKMPLVFTQSQTGTTTSQHEFLVLPSGNDSVSVVVITDPGANITARLYLCDKMVSSDEKAISIYHMSEYTISVCTKIRDGESDMKTLQVGVGTTPGGLQVQPFMSVEHSGQLVINAHVQHDMPLYAVAIAENYAGQVSRFISKPIRSDRTSPMLSKVKVTLIYPGDDRNSGNNVFAEAEWTAEDFESGIDSCICRLEGYPTMESTIQTTNDVKPGKCLWQLQYPRHGATIRVNVRCENGVHLRTSETSHAQFVLLHSPDMTHVYISSLSNNARVSPYDNYDEDIRSTNASLAFLWHGTDDPTLTQFQYRFLHESRPLSQWSPLHVYKSSAVLERGSQRLPRGEVTAQLRSVNDRGLMSEVISATVRLDDSKPKLTGKRATITTSAKGELVLEWQGVFVVSRDTVYSVYAGTDEIYGDVINHVTTKSTDYHGAAPNLVSPVFVSIQAVYVDGAFEFYFDKFVL